MRATKNLESLIKAANKAGYAVHLTQLSSMQKWYCYLFIDSGKIADVGHTQFMPTAHAALKAALDSIDWK